MRQMRRPRPFIPYRTRAIVAYRQIVKRDGERAAILALLASTKSSIGFAKILQTLLHDLFGSAEVHLDHDPALINRPYSTRIKDPAARYTPNANDPDYLVYRTKEEHDIKTRVRGDGAQYSDLALRRKLKRVERNRDPKRVKKEIPQRANPWPKGRKFRSMPR